MDSLQSCQSVVPWWTSFILSIGIFITGIIVMAVIKIKYFINRHIAYRNKMRLSIFLQKTQLLMTCLDQSNDSIDEICNGNKIHHLNSFFELVLSRKTLMGRILAR